MSSQGYSLADGGERTRVNVGGVQLRPCGTAAGAQRHRGAGEESCAACREAARRYRQYKKADNKYCRMLAAGASRVELGALNQRRLDLELELEYRSLERRTDTPQPPSRRWKVYRFDFDNGLQYVGIKTLAMDLTESEAYELEKEEIAKLEKPLNVKGPIQRGQTTD